MDRRVPLSSGGYLVIDDTEAMTVIDVNSGRNVGKGGSRLEDTITKTNLEAATEVVRQLRLRDIGGIVIIDFIDMDDERNRRAVKAALDQALARDRTRTYVVNISPLGLVEMTRQNISDGPREIMTEVCPTCAGVGVVAERRDAGDHCRARAARVAAAAAGRGRRGRTVHPRVADVLTGEDGARLADLAAEVGVEIRLERDDTLAPRPCACARSTTRPPRRRRARRSAPAPGAGSPPARAERPRRRSPSARGFRARRPPLGRPTATAQPPGDPGARGSASPPKGPGDRRPHPAEIDVVACAEHRRARLSARIFAIVATQRSPVGR